MNETKTSFKGWGLLSKYRVELMGASIIWIMLYHGYRNDMRFPGKLNFINFILSEGAVGVEIFLLLSGLGLYYSFSKNSNLKYFYKNRVKRVILPYFLVSGGFWIIQDLLYDKSISTFLKNITLYSFWRDGYNRLWYFALIIPLYLIFPILYYYIYGKQEYSKRKILIRASSLIILALLLNLSIRYLSKSYYELTEIALSRIIIFLLGILVGSYAKRNEEISYGVMVLILITYSTRLYDYESDQGDMFLRFWYTPLCFVVCFVLIYFFELLNLKARPNFILSKILSNAGTYSMELYIIHIWMRKFFNTISIDYHFHGINFNKFELLDYFLVLVSSLIITFFFVQIEKLLFKNRVPKIKHKI